MGASHKKRLEKDSTNDNDCQWKERDPSGLRSLAHAPNPSNPLSTESVPSTSDRLGVLEVPLVDSSEAVP